MVGLDWFIDFISNYNTVKYMAVLFILGQLVAFRNRDPRLSLNLQYALVVSFSAVYLLNYTLFVLVGTTILYSTLLLEISITLGVFLFPFVKHVERRTKQANQVKENYNA